MFYNVLRVWFDAKIKKKMDRKKTKLEVNEVFQKWKKASIKLYTMLAQVFKIQNLGINGSNYWFVMCHLMMILYIIQFLISIHLWCLLN